MKTSDLAYRQLAGGDVTALAALEAASFPTPWSAEQYDAMMRRGACTVFGAWHGVVLVGYIAVAVQAATGEMEVYNIAVATEYRRRGIGRKLLSLALEAAMLNRVEQAFLEVRETNEPAIALYTELGFLQAGVRPKYYPDTGEDALVLARSLK